jgi:hypothetical protein
LGGAFLGHDVMQPAAQVVAGAAGQAQAFGQGVCLFLALFQEQFGAVDLVIAVGAGEVAGLQAHLCRELQEFGFQMGEVGVLAQVFKAAAHRVKLAGRGKDTGAVGGMGGAIGVGDILHPHGKAAEAAFKAGHAGIGGQKEGEGDGKGGQGKLRPHARVFNGLVAEAESEVSPGQQPHGMWP